MTLLTKYVTTWRRKLVLPLHDSSTYVTLLLLYTGLIPPPFFKTTTTIGDPVGKEQRLDDDKFLPTFLFNFPHCHKCYFCFSQGKDSSPLINFHSRNETAESPSPFCLNFQALVCSLFLKQMSAEKWLSSQMVASYHSHSNRILNNSIYAFKVLV